MDGFHANSAVWRAVDSIANRAVVIRAIQRCLLSPLHTEKAVLHTAACSVIRGTFGKDLTLLKDLVHSSDELFSDVEPANELGEEQSGVATISQMLSISIAESARSPAVDVMKQHADEEPPHSGDLSHLIFENKNLTEVVQVMQHIAVEALKVKAEHPGLVKVVSDIDDTLFPGFVSFLP